MRVRKLFWWSLVLLTALALADGYLGSPTAGWGWERFITWGQPQLRPEGPSAETTGVVEAPMAPGEVLSVSNIRGNLQVTGGAADRLQTRYTITVFAEDEAAAAQYAEALEVVAVRREEGLVLELIRPAETPPGVQSVAVDYQIAVPRGARIQVENRLGQVEVAGVAGPSWVENGYGETVLRNLQGTGRSGPASPPSRSTRCGELWCCRAPTARGASGTWPAPSPVTSPGPSPWMGRLRWTWTPATPS